MDFLAVLGVLNDLPPTFVPGSGWYLQLVASTATALTRYTLDGDAEAMQPISLFNAVDGWLDAWGLLWGVPRYFGEANSLYVVRIQRTILAWVGTLPALQAWIGFYAPGGVISENSSGLGYVITLPTSMTSSQVQVFLLSLNRIRPAGVPFAVYQGGTGLFLGTEAFMGTGRVMGAYLASGQDIITLPLPATTVNSRPLLPGLYLVDPILNPSLGVNA